MCEIWGLKYSKTFCTNREKNQNITKKKQKVLPFFITLYLSNFNRCYSGSMNIRHLGGSSFHSAHESRSKKINHNHNNVLHVTSQHPPPPSSTNRFKKQTTHSNHYRLKKQTTDERDKSDSFVDVLNENRDWMIISKAGNLKQRSSNNIGFRNQNRKVDLTQSLPNDFSTSRGNQSTDDESFVDSTVIDENGNFIINGKSMDIPGLYTDEYLKQNYTKLSGNTAFRTAGMTEFDS